MAITYRTSARKRTHYNTADTRRRQIAPPLPDLTGIGGRQVDNRTFLFKVKGHRIHLTLGLNKWKVYIDASPSEHFMPANAKIVDVKRGLENLADMLDDKDPQPFGGEDYGLNRSEF